MSDRIKAILFAAILCLICSVLLTTASTGLKGFKEVNVLIDKRRNILKSVGLVQEGRTYTPDEIQTIYSQRIKELWVDPDGRLIEKPLPDEQDIPLYVYVEKEQIQAYIVPINSRGLWGRIYGYMAIKNDGTTITGFTVYKHSETPGLGGEIEKAWFQKNWVGKKIVDQGGEFVSVSIAKGETKDVVPKDKNLHYVDGISGATLTGKYLSAGIRDTLKNYEPVSIRFRKNLVSKPPG
ncbi:MAG: FMN-binding protein [Desulfobacterales bacterium]|jgi:Na+-transporting NADH:ubiquinone oxidoreductase subunit C